MHEYLFTCDGCKKEIKTNNRTGWPVGWMHFVVWFANRGSGDYHACSAKCAEKAGGKATKLLFEEMVQR